MSLEEPSVSTHLLAGKCNAIEPSMHLLSLMSVRVGAKGRCWEERVRVAV